MELWALSRGGSALNEKIEDITDEYRVLLLSFPHAPNLPPEERKKTQGFKSLVDSVRNKAKRQISPEGRARSSLHKARR